MCIKKAYELLLEAYRQQFRQLRIQEKYTFEKKEDLFLKW
jgi:hypothetical protein